MTSDINSGSVIFDGFMLTISQKKLFLSPYLF